MEDDEMESLACINIIDEKDPSLMNRKDLVNGWGSVLNFMLSYGLKPWKPEDCEEARNISRSFKEADQEDLKAATLAEEEMPPLALECCFYCKKNKSSCRLCSKCKLVKYCSVECQKKSWTEHKLICAPPPIEIAASMDFEEIQLLFRDCARGAVFKFGEGIFKESNEKKMVEARRRQNVPGDIQKVSIPVPLPLIISKSISLIGSCKKTTTGSCGNETIFPFSIVVEVDECEKKGGKLMISDLVVKNFLHVKDNSFQSIELNRVKIEVFDSELSQSSDALILGDCCKESKGGKVLLESCEIYGGSDGICTSGYSTNLHIRNCEIRFAASRGIFANSNFIIEDSEVSNCGAYGIKQRGGCDRRGDNDIQPGPWDHLPYG